MPHLDSHCNRHCTLTSSSGSRPTFGIDNFSLSYSAAAIVTNPVVILTQPQSVTNNAGSTVTLNVGESGTGPITNVWYQVQNGVTNMLNDGGFRQRRWAAPLPVPPAPRLTITGAPSSAVNPADTLPWPPVAATRGTNSATANVTIVDPFISVQPQSRTNLTGDLSEFDATIIGTQPVELTWYHGNSVIFDNTTNSGSATDAITIFVTNAVDTVGNYYIVASNPISAPPPASSSRPSSQSRPPPSLRAGIITIPLIIRPARRSRPSAPASAPKSMPAL